MVYFAFGKILTLALEAHMLNISLILLIRLDMHNSFNSSISRLESFQRFEFEGQIGAFPTVYEGFICQLAFTLFALLQSYYSPVMWGPFHLISPPPNIDEVFLPDSFRKLFLDTLRNSIIFVLYPSENMGMLFVPSIKEISQFSS